MRKRISKKIVAWIRKHVMEEIVDDLTNHVYLRVNGKVIKKLKMINIPQCYTFVETDPEGIKFFVQEVTYSEYGYVVYLDGIIRK
ncbi:hypothetical protein SAMN05216480_10519 [Pustulibacterium marinum]|uniref:Uncharacterized protein n=1 Tax=Pustulibacterium marinum TaxID=1224947 RepID=A0A1I7GK46_9FLAO|nr:hypothetical protein [Pustulibacterium marinum]SFU48813.1 hypothetical protein SAMN05216480_10519 [Pustulibacterium marinum]